MPVTFELLGESGGVELISLLGYYGLVSMTLNVFRVSLPPGQEAPSKTEGDAAIEGAVAHRGTAVPQ